MINLAIQMIDTNQANKKDLERSMLQSGLCDYSDAYIVVKGTITTAGANNKKR